MTHVRTVTLLLETSLPEQALRHAAGLPAHLQLVSTADILADPRLLEQVEIIYGWVQPDWWPHLTRLHWVQTHSAGVDGLLTPEGSAHPAVFTNVHIHGAPITEHLFGMLLMLARQLHTAYRLQLAHEWLPPAHVEVLTGKTLGILGAGTIGRSVAALGKAFGMQVVGLRRSPAPAPPFDRLYAPEQLPDMLPWCDYLMVTLPLTPETRHIIGAPELARMKPTALLFNVGRGPLIDTAALVAALAAGQLGGAGLDVVEPEPLPPDHPLWGMPNVLITAHYAGAQPHYAELAASTFLDNLQRYLSGQPLVNVVDKRVGY